MFVIKCWVDGPESDGQIVQECHTFTVAMQWLIAKAAEYNSATWVEAQSKSLLSLFVPSGVRYAVTKAY